jgi:hypothetical protein
MEMQKPKGAGNLRFFRCVWCIFKVRPAAENKRDAKKAAAADKKKRATQ